MGSVLRHEVSSPLLRMLCSHYCVLAEGSQPPQGGIWEGCLATHTEKRPRFRKWLFLRNLNPDLPLKPAQFSLAWQSPCRSLQPTLGISLVSPSQLGQARCRKPWKGHSLAARKGDWKFKYAFLSAWPKVGVRSPRLARALWTSPLKGISVHPTILPAGCLPALAWPRRDPQIQCASVNAKNNKKCNDVSFFKTIHTALLLSEEGGVKGAGKKTLTGTVDCKFLTACTLQCNCSQGATERTCLFLLQQSGPSPSNSPACPASSCPLHSQSSLWNFFT